MFIITALPYKRWRIEKGDHTFFSGIGELSTALEVAFAHGIAISMIETKHFLRSIQ